VSFGIVDVTEYKQTCARDHGRRVQPWNTLVDGQTAEVPRVSRHVKKDDERDPKNDPQRDYHQLARASLPGTLIPSGNYFSFFLFGSAVTG